MDMGMWRIIQSADTVDRNEWTVVGESPSRLVPRVSYRGSYLRWLGT